MPKIHWIQLMTIIVSSILLCQKQNAVSTVAFNIQCTLVQLSSCPHTVAYRLTLPLCMGVSRVRALSPAWTGSPAQETLISRTHLFPQQRFFLPILRVPSVLPVNFQNLPPVNKIKSIKSWPTFCDQYFWKFPIWNSCADEKCREIRMVKVNVIFNDIWLLICLTPLQVNWVMVVN